VNDVLMVVFFFVVGLELRVELAHGVLSQWRRALLPAGAALGGMLAPAALYLLTASAPAQRSGWGVPIATDIAFAIGALGLLGKRIPTQLRVLLLALAVIDDLGAIVVIAVAYSSGLAPGGLLALLAGVAATLVLQRLGVTRTLAYAAPALLLWLGCYWAGVHPTIAGVVAGLLTPVGAPGDAEPSPAETLRRALQPWVSLLIMPLFALANAGVSLTGLCDGLARPELSQVGLGVLLGLVVGKPLGILLVTWLLLRLGLAALPPGVETRHLLVLGVVAGIGFTMALFIAELAFTDQALLAVAKLAILVASAVAGVLAALLGFLLLPAAPQAKP
jgi:NhaA family Na+:H+ antiporter